MADDKRPILLLTMVAPAPRKSKRLARLVCFLAAAVLSSNSTAMSADESRDRDDTPILLSTQGSFLVGGNVVTNPGTFDPITLAPDGQTIHGDHAYAQFQIPEHGRRYPLVMWHGGGQFSKTWESTPDGRDGYQNIFLRRGFATYIIDQPHRGRAGRATANGTIDAVPGPGATGEQGIFIRFRIGIWPNYFPGVQFSHDPEALNQWWRQQTPDTAPTSNDVATDPVAALFDQIGPAVLLTHSASGVLGWITATKSANVKAIYAYEPVTQVFPEGQVPPPVPSGPLGPITGTPIPMSDFLKLTKIPIEIIWGDNFPTAGQPPSVYPDIETWQGRIIMAQQFVDLVNSYGGQPPRRQLWRFPNPKPPSCSTPAVAASSVPPDDDGCDPILAATSRMAAVGTAVRRPHDRSRGLCPRRRTPRPAVTQASRPGRHPKPFT